MSDINGTTTTPFLGTPGGGILAYMLYNCGHNLQFHKSDIFSHHRIGTKLLRPPQGIFFTHSKIRIPPSTTYYIRTDSLHYLIPLIVLLLVPPGALFSKLSDISVR